MFILIYGHFGLFGGDSLMFIKILLKCTNGHFVNFQHSINFCHVLSSIISDFFGSLYGFAIL